MLEVLQLLYGQVMSALYVLDPDMLGDTRQVSFRLVYDDSCTEKSASAFGPLANFLSGKFNLGIGSAAGNLGNFIQLKTPRSMQFSTYWRQMAV